MTFGNNQQNVLWFSNISYFQKHLVLQVTDNSTVERSTQKITSQTTHTEAAAI